MVRARQQEWITLALRISVVAGLYAALGSSQALQAIWLKSLWSLLPPVAFLAAIQIESRPPTPRFPYGFYRACTIAFLTAALALTCMGLYLLFTGSRALLVHHRPELATIDTVGGWEQWAGWWIIAALAYSAAIPWLLGRRRQQLAIALHDKVLYADATMGRADWLAGGAAIVGVLGIGFGLWWLDFVATLFIGADVTWHGLRHLRTAVCDLTDEVPRRMGSDALDPLGGQIRGYLRSLDWIADVRVRLREEGRFLTGVALIHPANEHDLIARLAQARLEIERMDWRLLDFHLVPVGDDVLTGYRSCYSDIPVGEEHR